MELDKTLEIEFSHLFLQHFQNIFVLSNKFSSVPCVKVFIVHRLTVAI